MQFATMAIAAQAGQPLRKRELDDTDRLRKQPVYWHQHDHDLSASGRKEIRRFPVAGCSTARLGHTKKPSFLRTQINGDRPAWMRGEPPPCFEDELPGGRSFTPANARFARELHFTSSFRGNFKPA
eukprot:g24612.t1